MNTVPLQQKCKATIVRVSHRSPDGQTLMGVVVELTANGNQRQINVEQVLLPLKGTPLISSSEVLTPAEETAIVQAIALHYQRSSDDAIEKMYQQVLDDAVRKYSDRPAACSGTQGRIVGILVALAGASAALWYFFG